MSISCLEYYSQHLVASIIYVYQVYTQKDLIVTKKDINMINLDIVTQEWNDKSSWKGEEGVYVVPDNIYIQRGWVLGRWIWSLCSWLGASALTCLRLPQAFVCLTNKTILFQEFRIFQTLKPIRAILDDGSWKGGSCVLSFGRICRRKSRTLFDF